MNRRSTLAALAIAIAAPAAAQPWGGHDATGGVFVPRGGYVPYPDPAYPGSGGINGFFYPDGYDPQYGSQGRVADAAEFAERYGCRPVWHARLNRYVPGCN